MHVCCLGFTLDAAKVQLIRIRGRCSTRQVFQLLYIGPLAELALVRTRHLMFNLGLVLAHARQPLLLLCELTKDGFLLLHEYLEPARGHLWLQGAVLRGAGHFPRLLLNDAHEVPHCRRFLPLNRMSYVWL